VLSLPCATGEEAYAASISLLEAGLRPARYDVRAVDISERALGHARLGLYGKNSFRGAGMAEHAGFFEPLDGGFRVVDAARSSVQFSRGNVLDATLCTPRAFDVILCRNLLIYLDAPARARALDNLSGWLSEDGVLFSGHAEAVERMDSRFERVAALGHFAYVKRSQKHEARAPSSGRGRKSVRPRLAERAPGRKRAQSPPPAPAASPAQPSLVVATELANRGELEAARRLCEQLIQGGPTPEAYCLLGIINNAGGDRDGAIACFNKSLYLNQAHYEALVHLALLHEQRGEQPAAANFRRRAERALRGEAK
jgi:chemotaxis protein methyltransferase WspC